MNEPRLKHVQCLDARGLHRMAYHEWGDPANARVVVCVHGLTRQGRDFDALAQRLSADFRVVCPDVVGRGHSDWLADPSGYAIPQYVADMVTLIARLEAAELHWVGTSMGGLIGLGVAALAGAPLRSLVLNDVGPALEWGALQRIGQFVGLPVRWPDEQTAIDALWSVSQGFGPHTPEQWRALCRPQLRQGDDGWRSHYDPAIGLAFRALTPELAAAGEAALWAAWDRITCPVLLLRGAASDLLSAATAQAMGERGPRARRVEFDGVGHAPTLVQPDQQEPVLAFLAQA
ncbi:alpha/beta fold hydrolase [Pseudaquabacterium rugosum]|uniref:Alpha/beta hydrolase n=1 Tax=Pseudaquabacterium rugosum TaxID=2984194 RepID=A0ABU9B520_9BURK